MALGMRSANPALSQKTFEQAGPIGAAGAMTIQGTVNKTGLMLLCVAATAA